MSELKPCTCKRNEGCSDECDRGMNEYQIAIYEAQSLPPSSRSNILAWIEARAGEISRHRPDLKAELVWSKEPPSAPGWYWMKSYWYGNSDTEIVNVIYRPGSNHLAIIPPTVCQHTKRDFIYVAKLNTEWCGPISEPVEAINTIMGDTE